MRLAVGRLPVGGAAQGERRLAPQREQPAGAAVAQLDAGRRRSASVPAAEALEPLRRLLRPAHHPADVVVVAVVVAVRRRSSRRAAGRPASDRPGRRPCVRCRRRGRVRRRRRGRSGRGSRAVQRGSVARAAAVFPENAGLRMSFFPSARRRRSRGRRRGRSASGSLSRQRLSQASRCDGRASVTSGQRAAAGQRRRVPQPPQRRTGRSACRQGVGRRGGGEQQGRDEEPVGADARQRTPHDGRRRQQQPADEPQAEQPGRRPLAAAVHQHDADQGRDGQEAGQRAVGRLAPQRRLPQGRQRAAPSGTGASRLNGVRIHQ